MYAWKPSFIPSNESIEHQCHPVFHLTTSATDYNAYCENYFKKRKKNVTEMLAKERKSHKVFWGGHPMS